MRLYLLVLLAACGRFGFDATTRGDAGGGDVPPGDATGSAGPRWAVTIGNNDFFLPVAGANGAPVIAYAFNGSTTVDGQMVTATATNLASVVARFDPAGNLASTTVLDATATCDVRGVAMRGDTVLAAALTNGSSATLGPCSVATPGRQEPIILSVDTAGTAALITLGTISGMNAQAWNIAPLPDDSFVTSGIYSQGLNFGTTSLPTAGADPNMWIARLADTQADALWAAGLTAGVQITPGPISVEDSDTCTLGGYLGAGLTELGTALPYAGSADVLLARLDISGTPRFVRGFGSVAKESDFNEGSVVASGGGCIASVAAPADLTIDSMTLLASDGGSIVVWFDGTGALTGGYRIPDIAQLAVVNGRVIAAYTITAPATIGGTLVTPQGQDIIVVELNHQGPTKVLGVVGGTGDQDVIRLAAIGPDAVAMTLASSGGFQFGSTSFTSAANDRVLAVLGL